MTIAPSVRLILPYALWMALMAVLPATAWGYAVRTVAVFIALCWALSGISRLRLPKVREAFLAVATGLLVFAIWVIPENFEFYRRCFIIGESGTGTVFRPECGGLALLAVRILGSAFVISVAEELFFRKFLIDFAGFWWTAVLFAVEHDRILVAFIAGLIYALLRTRISLLSAIIAHATTNLVLAVYVVVFNKWEFW